MAEELEQAVPDTQPDQAQQPIPPDKVKTLYDALSADHYELGDINQFRQKMTDPEKAGKLYDAATADHYQLGAKDEFIGKMAGQPKQQPQQNLVNADSVGTRPATNNYVSSLDPRVNSLKSQPKDYKPTLGSVKPTSNAKVSKDGMINSTIDMFKSIASLVPETASSILRAGSRLLSMTDPTSYAKQTLLDQHGGKSDADNLADKIDKFGESLNSNSGGSQLGQTLKLPAMIATGLMTGDAPLALQALAPMMMAGTMHNSAYHEALQAGASNGTANLFGTVSASAGMLINGAAMAGVSGVVKSLASKVIAKAAIQELAESGAEKITQDAFQQAISKNTASVITKIRTNAGGDFLKVLGYEAGAGIASHEFDQFAKYVHNHAEAGVNHHIETFGENALAAVKQGGLYALMGSIGAGAKLINDIHGSDAVGDHIVNAISHDPASADVMRNHADQLLENSHIDPAERESPFAINADQHEEIHQKIDRVEAINSSIPDHVSEPEDRAKSIGIISQRNEIDNHIAELEVHKSTLDEAYHEPIDNKIDKLTEIRDGLTTSLKNIKGSEEDMPTPHDKLLGKDTNPDSEPSQPEESVKDAVPEKEKPQDPNEKWSEDKQVILNNSSDDSPKEYKGISEARQQFKDLVDTYKESAKAKDTDRETSKKEFLKGTKDLLKKIGKDVPANVKALLPQVIKLSNTIKDTKTRDIALDKMSSIVDDIHQKEGEQNAGLASKKLTKTSSLFKGVDPRLTTAIQQLAKLGKKPQQLSDPHEYADFAKSIVDKNGNLTVKTNDIERYVNEQMTHIKASLKDNAIAGIQKKIDEMEAKEKGSTHNVKAEDVYDSDSLHSAFFTDTEATAKESAEPEPTVIELVTSMIKDAQTVLPSEEGLSPKQAATLRALKNIDPDMEFNKMSLADRKILNFALHNIIHNGPDTILKGTDELVQYYLSNELHKSIESSRKDFQDTYFNFLKRWGIDKVRLIEGANNSKLFLRLRKDKVTFNQAVKGLNPNAEFVRKVYGSYLKPFELDYGKAKGEVTLHVKTLLHLHKEIGATREDGARMRIFSILRQVNLSSPQSEDSQFQALKETVAKSMEVMTDHFKGVQGNTFKRQSELIDILHKSGLADLFKNHIDEITKDNMENLLGITDRHMKVIDAMDLSHAKVKPEIMEMYEKMGIDASDVHNYTHMDYLHLKDAQQVGMATRKSTETVAKAFFGKADIDNLGPHVTARQDLAHTPPDSYLNLDQASSFTRGMNKQLMSAHTISNRMLIHNMMNDTRTSNVFDRTMDADVVNKEDTNAKFFKNMIHQNIGDAMGTTQRAQGGWMDAQNWMTVLLNDSKSLFYRGTLGSVFQYPKQYVESGTAAAILLGNPEAYLHGMGFITRDRSGWEEFKQLLIDDGSPVLRRMVDREDLHSSALDDAYSSESTGYVDLHDSFTRKSHELNELLIGPLKKGDAAVSVHTYISAYSMSLKKQGIIKNFSDFNQEFLKTHKLDKIASAYADDMVERTNAKVEGPFRAGVLQNGGEKTLKSLFWNMKTFQLHANIEARLALRNIMAGVDGQQSARQLLGYGASQVASGAMKLVAINPIRTTVAMGIVHMLLGDERFDKLQKQRLEQLQKGGRLLDQDHLSWVKEYTGLNTNNGRNVMNIGLQITSDIFMGSQDNVSQGGAQFLSDYLYKEFMYKAIQGKMEKADARKSLFYSDGNFFGYGSYQAVVNGVITPMFGNGAGGKGLGDRIKDVAETSDKVKLGAAQLVATSAQLFLGADAGRVAQMVNSNLQKYMENNEFKLDSYYEGLKTLVEKTGIPIAPMNLDAVNKLDLRDNDGKELMLTGQQIKDLDRAYAIQLKDNLDPEELISGDIDEAKEEVAKEKKEALNNALDEILGEDTYKLGAEFKKEQKSENDTAPAQNFENMIVSETRTFDNKK